jgi:hypothetical protein
MARGRALVALDRRHYPPLTLPDGRKVQRGILHWAPVLREMDEPQLHSLVELVESLKARNVEVVDE